MKRQSAVAPRMALGSRCPESILCLQCGRQRITRRYSIDPDTRWPEFGRQGFGQGHDRGLGGPVSRLSRGAVAVHRGKVDDTAPAGRLHHPPESLAAGDGAQIIDPQDALGLGEIHVENARGVLQNTAGIDQDVRASELRGDGFRGSRD